MNTGPEHALQIAIVKFVRAHVPQPHFFTGIDRTQRSARWSHARQKSRGILAGVPDTLLIMPGLPTILIELKAKGRRVEDDSAQDRVGEAIQAAGGLWGWCDSVDGYAAILRGFGVALQGRWDLAAAHQDALLAAAAIRKDEAGGAVSKRRYAKKDPRYTLGKAAVGRARKAGIMT